ncbi:tetratricopeptide repeat protein [Streptomyces actinomycinicus]|uniref:Tetratricopeptide repeat protein n=1 Tax=Streptomyces actinomycinicus TaxID=1695166 RepID=A0A937EIC4_9ACTN|nr:AfsR/SARP family transcriptional regulator [Streptomyces actinomycinicus]MBL1083632.1 tetratricopeptide repeat protein [Streptomyces actinomycinicus]
MPSKGELPTGGSRLRFAVLGPLQAWRGDVQLDLGPVRQQALLTALLLRPGTTVSRQQLLDGVWGPEPPGTGAKVIPVYVHQLRRRLGPEKGEPSGSLIVTDRGGYRFDPRNVSTDVARLREIVAEAHAARDSGDLAGAVSAWSAALELFHGDPLTAIPGPFAEAERLRLSEHRLTLVQDKAECQLRLGRHAEVVGELFALSETHPHNESLAALLMRALYAGNRQADALSVFAKVRRRLVQEQGAEPGGELRRVHEAVLRADETFLVGAPPRTRRSTDERPAAAHLLRRVGRVGHVGRVGQVGHELPVDVSGFTGRNHELDVLLAPTDEQAVTVRAVDGMAGVGKTALVVRAARAMRDRFPDGCLFVDLHGHRQEREAAVPQRVLRRLLRAVGDITEGDDDSAEDLDGLAASWRAATADLRLILVVDDACAAQQVRPLLPAGPGSLVLLTSRQRLTALDADRRVSLAPLDMDEAVALLTRAVGGTDSARERAAVRELARLCDRLPLALRVVGARMQSRPLWALERMAIRLADDEHRLGELSVEDRSVEAAFRVSYDQLPDAERQAFRVLGLSPTVEFDRLTLAAMLDLTPSDAERVLESLVEASLVQHGVTGRYRLHDLVAVYARRVAAAYPAEVAAARTRVFRLYVVAARCASDWGPFAFPTGPRAGTAPFADWEEAAAWLDAVGGELVDVVAHAAAVGHVNDAGWLAEGLCDYLTRHGRYHECRAAIEIVLPLTEQVTDQRMVSELRTCMGIAYGLQGQYEQARRWLGDALRISRRTGDVIEQARALGSLGIFANAAGEPAEAAALLARSADLAQGAEDDWLAVMYLANVGAIHHQVGQHDKAQECYAASVGLAERIGRPRILSKTLFRMGALQLDRGHYAEAADTLSRAAGLAERVGDIPLFAAVLGRLATAEEHLGNLAGAARLHFQALAAVGERPGTRLKAEIRNRLGWPQAATEDLVQARDRFERAIARPRTESGELA